MKLTILAAADKNWGIGLNEGLPWHIPEDLKCFRERTMKKIVVVGRKTADTLPLSLPGREIVILTRTPTSENMYTFDGLMNRLQAIEDEVIIGGGSEIYRQMLPYCQSAEITRVFGDYVCDTYMDDLSLHGWKIHQTSPLSTLAQIEEWRP